MEQKSRFYYQKALEQSKARMKNMKQWFLFIGIAAAVIFVWGIASRSWAMGLGVGCGTGVILLVCYAIHYRPESIRAREAMAALDDCIRRGE